MQIIAYHTYTVHVGQGSIGEAEACEKSGIKDYRNETLYSCR